MSFKLCVLSSMMKSHTAPLRPAWDVNHPFVQRIHTVYATCLLVQEKQCVYVHIYTAFGTIHGFRYPLGVLERIPHG